MATEKIADLKVKIEKLKEAELKLRNEIDEGRMELEQLNTSIQRGNIELDLINDAFALKFGDISESEKQSMLNAMDQVNQIEILEAQLSLENEKVRQAELELERLKGIAPAAPVQTIDIYVFENQEKELAESLKSQKIRNGKREKNIKLLDSKIASILVELEEIDKKVNERKQYEQEVAEKQKDADSLQEEINNCSNQYKSQNQAVKDMQDKLEEANKEIDEINALIAENQDLVENHLREGSELQNLLQYISDSNSVWEQSRLDHIAFEKRSTKIRSTLTDMLQQITSLIDVIKAEME